MLVDYNYTWLVISLSQWLWSHVWIYFGTHQSGSARRSYSSWARADHPRVSQAACRKGNQSSLKANLLFLSQNDFGNLNFHQCKYKFLCSALRLIGTMFSRCLVTLPHPVSPWPRERGQQTDSSARSSATGRRAWARSRERGQGSPPALTLICIPGPADDNTDLLHQLPLLTEQRKGHKNQCRWGAWTQDFKEEAISPGPSFCISPPLISNYSIEQHLFRNYSILKMVEGLMW